MTRKLHWFLYPCLVVMTGCGGAPKEAPVSDDVVSFQEQLGRFLFDQSEEFVPNSGKILVMIQQEQGVMSRPDQQRILQSFKESASEVEVVEIPLEHIQLGFGVNADAYSEALAGVRPGLVISMVGVPLGTSLSAPGRNTPLLVLMEQGVPAELLQTEAKFPHKWRLLSPSATMKEAQTPTDAYNSYSSP